MIGVAEGAEEVKKKQAGRQAEKNPCVLDRVYDKTCFLLLDSSFVIRPSYIVPSRFPKLRR